ncbi:unnamed protein product, partial [Didymodactylos carnosus]
ELRDKDRRDKLWNIYLGDTNDMDDRRSRAETLRMKNIEKQLAVLNKNRLLRNDSLTIDVSSPKPRYDSSPISDWNRPRMRRRSSLDQQIIEQWKAMADDTKGVDQLPWPIRKLLIRRHFRRHLKETSLSLMNEQSQTLSADNGEGAIET